MLGMKTTKVYKCKQCDMEFTVKGGARAHRDFHKRQNRHWKELRIVGMRDDDGTTSGHYLDGPIPKTILVEKILAEPSTLRRPDLVYRLDSGE